MEFLGALGAISGAGINPGTVSPFISSAQNQAYTQQNIHSYFQGQLSLDQNKENAFTKSGLPSYMAYTGTGNSSNRPSQVFNLGGSNYWQSGPVGARMPAISNQNQWFNHWGTPSGYSGATSGLQTTQTGRLPNGRLETNVDVLPHGNESYSGQTDMGDNYIPHFNGDL